MCTVADTRKKLLAQRRDLFCQVAQTEEELFWLETDVESEAEERGQGEKMVQLLDRLDERMKAEIEAIDRALVKLEAGRYGQCEQCGEDISQPRLEVLPAEPVCIGCAQARETRMALWT